MHASETMVHNQRAVRRPGRRKFMEWGLCHLITRPRPLLAARPSDESEYPCPRLTVHPGAPTERHRRRRR